MGTTPHGLSDASPHRGTVLFVSLVVLFLFCASAGRASAQDACACGDGATPILGCCGGDGQRTCNTTGAFTDCQTACQPGLTVAPGFSHLTPFLCVKPRGPGEACGPAAPCAGGFKCDLDLKCYPEFDNELIDETTCRSYYSAHFHDQIMRTPVAFTIGIGGGAAAGISASAEAGLVYGPDGRYGCYYTTCEGFGIDIGFSVFASSGFSLSYDAVAGHSTVYSASGGLGAINFGVSLDFAEGALCTPDVTQESSGFQGMTFEVSTGLGLPISASCYSCSTTVRTVVEPLTPRAVCTDYSAIQGRTETGEPLLPLPTSAGNTGIICANQNSCTGYVDIDNHSFPRRGSTLHKEQNPSAGNVPINDFSTGLLLLPPSISLKVTDEYGLSDTCHSSVIVADCVPPEMTCPDPVRVECAGPQPGLNGAPGTLVDPPAATAADRCSPSFDKLLDLPMAAFPLGKTPLSYYAADSWVMVSGIAACAPVDVSGTGLRVIQKGDSFVEVKDTIGPNVSCPVSQTLECQGGGARAFFTTPTSAPDTCDGQSFPVTCTKPSGTQFGLGTSEVSCSATDASGNAAACGFAINVKDTLKPEITCPAPRTVECTGNLSAQVTLAPSLATDTCDGSVAVTCSGGSTFPLGHTEVTCSATDRSGNQQTCATSVTVVDTRPPDLRSVTATPSTIIGTDHRMETVTIAWDASDACNPDLRLTRCALNQVISNEPDSGTSPDDLPGDTVIVQFNQIKVRAERDPNGKAAGRSYLAIVECEEPTGLVIRAAEIRVIDAPVCASNITNQLSISRGAFRFDRRTGRYSQVLSVKNAGPTNVQGPLSLALDGLSNATLFGAEGTTGCVAPLASPYVTLNAGADSILTPGETTTITLQFVNPTNTAISYTPRVLAGTASR